MYPEKRKRRLWNLFSKVKYPCYGARASNCETESLNYMYHILSQNSVRRHKFRKTVRLYSSEQRSMQRIFSISFSILCRLGQCFSTAVSRHTIVARDFIRCAVGNYQFVCWCCQARGSDHFNQKYYQIRVIKNLMLTA